MRKWAFILLIMLSGCGGKSFTPSAAGSHPYTFTWKDNGNPGVPNCSAVIIKGCLSSYTLREGTTVIATGIDPATDTYILSTTTGEHTYSLSVIGVMALGGNAESPYLVETVNVP
jgi:hypothetical protein